MKWYLGVYADLKENEYEVFASDEEAIEGFTNAEDNDLLLEIYRCEDDECLSPEERIWP